MFTSTHIAPTSDATARHWTIVRLNVDLHRNWHEQIYMKIYKSRECFLIKRECRFADNWKVFRCFRTENEFYCKKIFNETKAMKNEKLQMTFVDWENRTELNFDDALLFWICSCFSYQKQSGNGQNIFNQFLVSFGCKIVVKKTNN
jgi:hypothetical protein